MTEKLIITTDSIIQPLKIGYDDICSKLKSCEEPCLLNDEVKRFFDKCLELSTAFFYEENAGNTIKKMYCIGYDTNPTIHSMDFKYAFYQYNEYLNGMLKYIEEGREKDITDSVIKDSVEDIILKDEDFIRSIFEFESNKHNPEKESLLLDTLNDSFITLFSIRHKIDSFKNDECSNTIFDKLFLLSKVNMSYYAINGIITQTERVVRELNGEIVDPSSTNDELMFAVF